MTAIYDKNINALLVYDGKDVAIPPCMLPTALTPNELLSRNVMQGTWADKLTELSGRICYDSLASTGKIRTSPEYHDHIRIVNHLSVDEHATFTAILTIHPDQYGYAMKALLNRPGLWVGTYRHALESTIEQRVTVNLRTVMEWRKWTAALAAEGLLAGLSLELAVSMGETLIRLGAKVAPLVVVLPPVQGLVVNDGGLDEPQTQDEKWISLYLSGSRGFSHEQCRHGDFSAISQRSTRFVDECDSEWIEHPLISEYVQAGVEQGSTLKAYRTTLCKSAQDLYRTTVELLQPWLEGRGVDKFSARKQARGAARGDLGNALMTEMIFSASIRQWRWMLGSRANAGADAEIRVLYCRALPLLKGSRHGHLFGDIELVDAPDGLGQCAVFK